MRSSPSNTRSSPPLKKKVTCAYFSVSAMRSCFRPAFDTVSPRPILMTAGGNSVLRNGLSAAE